MTRLVPAIPPDGTEPQPIGDLSAEAGWTLYDPSGIIAVAPVNDGADITVGFNAVAGVAILTRPLTTDPDEVTLLGLNHDVVTDPATSRIRCTYGVSTVDGSRTQTCGVDMTPGAKRPMTEENGLYGNGSNTILSSSRMFGLTGIGNRYPESAVRWGTNFTGVRTSSGPTKADATRADSPNSTVLPSDYECLRFETDGVGAETIVWNVLTFIQQPFKYDL